MKTQQREQTEQAKTKEEKEKKREARQIPRERDPYRRSCLTSPLTPHACESQNLTICACGLVVFIDE